MDWKIKRSLCRLWAMREMRYRREKRYIWKNVKSTQPFLLHGETAERKAEIAGRMTKSHNAEKAKKPLGIGVDDSSVLQQLLSLYM